MPAGLDLSAYRVALHGGVLEARLRPDGGFDVGLSGVERGGRSTAPGCRESRQDPSEVQDPQDRRGSVVVRAHATKDRRPRHPLYQRTANEGTVATPRGPVRYEYHSMADLSRYETASFDLVYSGQTFEHCYLLAYVCRSAR